MPKTFDTNPLDPDFPERAKAKAAAATGRETPFKTAEFPNSPSSITEEETRRFSDADLNNYWQPQQTPQMYQAPRPMSSPEATIRLSSGTKVPSKWLIGLPYLPFSVGLVAGLILLFVIPKKRIGCDSTRLKAWRPTSVFCS